MRENTLLWLDDRRNPFQDRWIERFSPIQNPDIIWVRSYSDFINYIEQHGLPDAICFDHDLGDIHSDHEYTGYDCAKYVVEYCMDHNKIFPKYNIQSDNGPGRDNIYHYIENFKKNFNHN